MTKPLTVTREEAYQSITRALTEEPYLIRETRNAFYAAGPNAGKPTSELTLMAGNLANTILDKIFTDGQTEMTRGDYRRRVVTLARAPEAQQDLLYTFVQHMSVSPFRGYTHAPELAKSATKALRTHARLIRNIDKAEAEPSVASEPVIEQPVVNTEIETPASLTRDQVEQTIQVFFMKQPEMWQPDFGTVKVWLPKAETRANTLTRATMNALSEGGNTSWEERIRAAIVNETKLESGLKECINDNCHVFSRKMYDVKGARLNGDRMAAEYAKRICAHLASAMDVEQTSVAVADEKAPATIDLAAMIAEREAGKRRA